MARFTCAHIKKDNTICGNKCCDPTGCYRHWKLYEKNIEKKPCLVSGCRKYTLSTTGCCPDHSSRFHSLNYRMKQKYKAEALQPKIPEAPISKSDNNNASIHEHLFSASLQLFADSLRRDLTDSIRVEILSDKVVINGSATETPRIYEDPVSESDDEDMGLGLFGD
ncbi:uncharacterized protein OCT59_003091 [Rhizophagus irregularis]|uniref:Uncharacterized protein n=1 Tax=Rhizophagus irregularis (strain DAOM 181602 / DAOM 197198 / MUCL 43194) TaxID=747089 RepID=A0A2H5T2V6_RHIID|nr:hypothetical protein GLOIN_2v1769522 [Rhizophagus irregularis DAOM 181602=DAOM 197198]POG76090.1 hypothetical protein GLOIN_2v1769522 [Rhizophagus irregularis DAOM 181602=DAOM 197198]UZO11527.1 hypothetical protein OCT59_003091 [Rhizophagus irregularis]GBC36891.1 hypothetical protein GLOIN_2v1769522 [Rhizophagus irregularis DAOM 181602=DAOM 197198]|eukprot:XP_025182956.1 hypothetical protein GLOIN_2v1769522 [Rhizophagus irregularis DAOM 181602=DAOM 197198]